MTLLVHKVREYVKAKNQRVSVCKEEGTEDKEGECDFVA